MKQSLSFGNMRVLLAHGNKPAAQLYESILRGFGVHTIQNARTPGDLVENFGAGRVDLAIIDNSIGADELSGIIARVRREKTATARDVPIVLSYCHSGYRDVLKFRDSGANMIMSAPFTVDGVYDRIAWIARKPRPFVISEGFCGPCRRVKPNAMAAIQGRRHDDRSPATDSTTNAASDDLAIV